MKYKKLAEIDSKAAERLKRYLEIQRKKKYVEYDDKEYDKKQDRKSKEYDRKEK